MSSSAAVITAPGRHPFRSAATRRAGGRRGLPPGGAAFTRSGRTEPTPTSTRTANAPMAGATVRDARVAARLTVRADLATRPVTHRCARRFVALGSAASLGRCRCRGRWCGGGREVERGLRGRASGCGRRPRGRRIGALARAAIGGGADKPKHDEPSENRESAEGAGGDAGRAGSLRAAAEQPLNGADVGARHEFPAAHRWMLPATAEGGNRRRGVDGARVGRKPPSRAAPSHRR